MSSPSLFALVRNIWFPLLCGFLYFATINESWAIDWDADGAVPPDGIFNVANNWNPNQVPGVGDTTTFGLADVYTVTLDGNAASDILQVLSGDVTLLSDSATVRQFDLITGSGIASVLQGGILEIGSASNPVFLNVSDLMSIGPGGGNGTVVLSGADSRLDVLGTGQNIIGNFGLTGMFSVTSGATANYGINGTLVVANPGTGGTQGIVSVNGAGTLNTGHIDIASGNSGNTGSMTVSGAGSLIEQTLTGATLVVGGVGDTGTISVESGSTFTTGTGAITVNAMGTVNIDDGTFNANGPMTMSAGSTLTLNGGSLNANAGLDNSALGTLDLLDGKLTVTGGSFVPNAGGPLDDYTIDGPTGTETPHLEIGAGATAALGVDFYLGNVNHGELTISGGGDFTNVLGVIGSGANSIATATVTDTGSTWMNSNNLFVGISGRGTLNILSGGEVSNIFGYIARNDASIGSVTVSGDGSRWINSNNLEVGGAGDGSLNILNGGEVSNSSGSIGGGVFSDSVATVDGEGSKWMNSSILEIGNQGDGVLNILKGGEVSSSLSQIGLVAGSTGVVTVDGSDFSGNASTWTNQALIVGQDGDGTLIIQDGGEVTTDGTGRISAFSGSTGTATVTGTGSQWIISDDLYVGGSGAGAGGTGNLIVENQGLVQVADTLKVWDTAAVTINGGTLEMEILDVEPSGVVTLNFGTLHFTNDLTLMPSDAVQAALGGEHALSFGQTLQVDGTTSLSNILTIGGGTFSTGTLDNAQWLQFNTGTLGITGAGGLTVGPVGPLGASLSVGSDQSLEVTNTLTVDAGATLSLATSGSISAALLDNSGVVRGSGAVTASLTNQPGGVVQVQFGDQLGFTDTTHSNAGNFQLQGGRIDFGGILTNNATGNILGRGTLAVGGAGLINEGDLALSNGQTDIFGDVANQTTGRVIISGNSDVTFWDDVTDSGTLFNVSTGSSATFFGTAGFGISGGGDVFFEDDVTPGSSPGLETFGGNVHFGVLSELQIEIAGTVPGSEFDLLDIAGTSNLGGTLDISLINGFTPTAGDTFEIITAASVLGVFDTINLPSLPDDLLWFVNYDSTSVELVTTYGADFDEDGDVDDFDLASWQGGLGSGFATHMTGDANADTTADGFDFLAWQRQFGNAGAAPFATAVAVPEPSSLLLVGLAGVLLGSRRRPAKALRLHQPHSLVRCPNLLRLDKLQRISARGN